MPIPEDSPRGSASERFDAFGFDLARYDATMRLLNLYFKYWHRVSAEGLEKIPEGPMIAYGNHAGFNLLDALMLMVATRQHAPWGFPSHIRIRVGTPWKLGPNADIEAARQSAYHALASMVTCLENEPCP